MTLVEKVAAGFMLLRWPRSSEMSKEIIRVLRIVEYTGPREMVEAQVSSSIHGQVIYGHITIRAATIGLYPEILEGVQDETKAQS